MVLAYSILSFGFCLCSPGKSPPIDLWAGRRQLARPNCERNDAVFNLMKEIYFFLDLIHIFDTVSY